MTIRLDRALDRRQFLWGSAGLALAVNGFSAPRTAKAQGVEDPPNTHNMLVVGERTIFLSHLPMFDGLDPAQTAFRSPHRYQVILEAAFAKAGTDVSALYFKDRQEHPDTRIYTLMPERFVLSRLFTPPAQPRLTTFSATVFRGHLEQGGTAVPGLDKTVVTVHRVVHARKFEPQTQKPAELEYILFGKGAELLAAHAIVAPPDFDHVLSVKLTGRELTAQDLAQEVRVVVPDRQNLARQRLREKQRVPVMVRTGPPGTAASTAQLEAGVEFYFEEGELLVPPTFEPTAEEKAR